MPFPDLGTIHRRMPKSTVSAMVLAIISIPCSARTPRQVRQSSRRILHKHRHLLNQHGYSSSVHYSFLESLTLTALPSLLGNVPSLSNRTLQPIPSMSRRAWFHLPRILDKPISSIARPAPAPLQIEGILIVFPSHVKHIIHGQFFVEPGYHLFHLRREHIHAPDDEHIVGTPSTGSSGPSSFRSRIFLSSDNTCPSSCT